MKCLWKTAVWLIVAAAGLASSAYCNSIVVGDIQVCYNCAAGQNFGGLPVLDGPVFAIFNTSASAIDNAVFTADGDSFQIGTIAAGGSFVIEPGVTSDGGSGHTFFNVTGSILDTSDSGPNADSTPFSFIGTQGLLTASTGLFTPGDTKGPSNDGTIAQINFLGGGPQSDGACNDCFGPKIVATITIPTSTVPEPSSLVMLGVMLAGLAWRRAASIR